MISLVESACLFSSNIYFLGIWVRGEVDGEEVRNTNIKGKNSCSHYYGAHLGETKCDRISAAYAIRDIELCLIRNVVIFEGWVNR